MFKIKLNPNYLPTTQFIDRLNCETAGLRHILDEGEGYMKMDKSVIQRATFVVYQC